MTNWTKVTRDMMEAAEKVAQHEWPKLKSEAEAQFVTLTQVAARIEARKVINDISETNARHQMRQYQIAAFNIMYSTEGTTNLLLEQALNSALGVLRREMVLATGGWVLL